MHVTWKWKWNYLEWSELAGVGRWEQRMGESYGGNMLKYTMYLYENVLMKASTVCDGCTLVKSMKEKALLDFCNIKIQNDTLRNIKSNKSRIPFSSHGCYHKYNLISLHLLISLNWLKAEYKPWQWGNI